MDKSLCLRFVFLIYSTVSVVLGSFRLSFRLVRPRVVGLSFCLVLSGSARVVELLLDASASLHILDDAGTSPLIAACTAEAYTGVISGSLRHFKDPLAVRYLLNSSAAIDHSNKYGCSALIAASISNLPGHVRFLCVGGANIHQTDVQGRTALFWATLCGNFKIVRILINAGGFKDKADFEGKTPLTVARQFECKKVVPFLHRVALAQKCSKGDVKAFSKRARRRLGKSKWHLYGSSKRCHALESTSVISRKLLPNIH